MYIRKDVSPKIVWFFSRIPVLYFTVLGVFAYVSYIYWKWTALAIPFLPVATIGTAVAFYVGFKNNASYERLWEARKIWAEIEHLSRFWAMLLTQSKVLDESGHEQNLLMSHRLVYRQIAWANCLRCELRGENVFDQLDAGQISQVQIVDKHDAHQSTELKQLLLSFIPEAEAAEVLSSNNMSAVLLTKQISDLHALKSLGMSTDEYSKLLDILQACSQQQSAAERINRFPFPRQYASFSGVFVFIFTTLLPFSLVNDFEKNDPALVWLVVPISVLISWIFYTMEKVGDSSENPFENGLNDVPMTSICRDIEIDLKSMLREENIPERLTPKQGILM